MSISSHVSFCHWAAPQYGDGGEGGLQSLLSVVAFAVAVWSAYEQMRIFQMRYDIAKGYANIAQERWDRFNAAYKPLENAVVDEISAQGPVVPDYAGAKSEYSGFADNAYGDAERRMRLTAARYALCVDPTLVNDLNLSASVAKDDGVNFGYRHAEWYAILRDDVRWNNRAAILNLGRDLLAQSAKYGSMANDMLANAGQAAGEAMGGALSYLGYRRNRQETYYPSQFTSSASPGGMLDFGGNLGVGDLGPGAMSPAVSG
jgi:hypothetical protein